MSSFRAIIILVAGIFLLAQIWNQRRDSDPINWLWMFLMASVVVGVWLGTRRQRPGSWRHTRRLAFLLLAVGLAGSAALLCTAGRM